MKAVLIHRYGSPDVLKLGERPQPVPSAKQVLVRVEAATVTSGDARIRRADPWLVRIFFGFLKPKREIPGFEFAGTVHACGEAVTQWNVGDRIFGVTGATVQGALAEYLVVEEEGFQAIIPEGWTAAEAAAIPFGACTALYYLEDKASLRAGETLLIYGASGAVGVAAMQVARILGAEVDAVCGPDHVELMQELGAKQVFNYRKGEPAKGSYDVIFDAVGKWTPNAAAPLLASSGRYVTVNRGYAAERREDYPRLQEWMASAKLKAVIGKQFPIEEIREAHRYVDSGHKRGAASILL